MSAFLQHTNSPSPPLPPLALTSYHTSVQPLLFTPPADSPLLLGYGWSLCELRGFTFFNPIGCLGSSLGQSDTCLAWVQRLIPGAWERGALVDLDRRAQWSPAAQVPPCCPWATRGAFPRGWQSQLCTKWGVGLALALASARSCGHHPLTSTPQ